MKLLGLAFCAFFCGVVIVPSSALTVGARECTWGPSYWCSNITNAKGCHAVQHCIQTVWEKQNVPEDNDSICQICLDMVKQARDQLESNQTQEDLKAVFEGSCKLIPIKLVQKECMKLADDFIPELVEALASQMNPQVVCSVAGLCNNAAIDKMLEELKVSMTTPPKQSAESESPNSDGFSCTDCNNIATVITQKFESTDSDVLLNNMLAVCGKFGSFSDACSNIILTYFADIYKELKLSINPESICHMSGTCASRYHQHPELVEIRPKSDIGYIPVNKDDIPCELCEQLIKHLRDLLITNTTEAEFKQVLEGLCNQTGGFQKECLSIVDQYYDVIYETLVNDLDPNAACFMIGICQKGVTGAQEQTPIAPFLPILEPQRIEVKIRKIDTPRKMLGADEPVYSEQEIQNAQLPIDKLMGPPVPEILVENGQLCTLCEYMLHFIQEALSTPSNEEEIKTTVKKVCEKFPTSIRGECDNFVDMYGDAVIALLIQGIDPRSVCPKIKMCPEGVEDMEVFAPKPIHVDINSKPSLNEKPNCALCLLAVRQAQELIKSNKTEEKIKQVLDNLCLHLPKKLKDECTDFVETYSHELIEMLINDFTPQEICKSLKLCADNRNELLDLNIHIISSGDIMTNEIPDNTINGREININVVKKVPGECMLCQKVVKEIEKKVVNKKSRDQIKHALEHACDKLGKYRKVCNSYIEKHGDKIIDYMMKGLSAKAICLELGLCWIPAPQEEEPQDLDIDEALHVSVVAVPAGPNDRLTGIDDIVRPENLSDDPQCMICQFIMTKLEEELKDKDTDEEIKHEVEHICAKLPDSIARTCNTFVEMYGDMVISLLTTLKPKEICGKLNLCPALDIKLTDAVRECGVCHGTVMSLNNLLDDVNSIPREELADRSCSDLPAKHYKKCSELVQYYGESIINLLNANTELSDVCAKIGMCFENEQSKLAYATLKTESGDVLSR